MKTMITILTVAVVLFATVPVSANGFAEQFHKKLELRNEQLGIATQTIFNASFAAETKLNGFINPTLGTFTSGYGWRDIGEGQEFHKGVDIGNVTGTDIKASQGGQVVYSGEMGTYGNVIILSHTIQEQTYSTVYAHLSLSSVVVGQTVLQGQSIGKMGTTGRSTGSHLHFEIHEGIWNSSRSNAVDPLKYIEL